MADNGRDKRQRLHKRVCPAHKVSIMTSSVVSLDDIEAVAVKKLPRNALDYFRSGAEDMITLQDNRDAFRRLHVVPNKI